MSATAFPNPDRSSFVDRPFAPPLQTVLYLPKPPSVNKTRRVDYASAKVKKRWMEACDAEILAAGGLKKFTRMPGQFEVTITLDENLNKIDLDNGTKILVDYCRRIGLIINDNKQYMRRVVLEWGHAPRGCRVQLRSVVA